MAKYIAHASIGSNNKAKGDAAGDQGKEVCIRTWYSYPYNCVIRIDDEEVRKKFGNNCIDIANNQNIGYDQSGRNTLLTEAEKVNFDFTKITVPCECDCSSMDTIALLGAIYVILGKDAYLEAKTILVVKGNCATTSTFKSRVKKLVMISITVFETKEYCQSTTKAIFGDIYLKEGKHMTTYIDDGNKISDELKEVTYKLKTLRKGSTGNDVTIFEAIMKKMGYYTGEIDKKFGSGCVAACNAFQKDYPECGTNGEPDGTFGPKCWEKALSLLSE